jgi:hypothetical protein
MDIKIAQDPKVKKELLHLIHTSEIMKAFFDYHKKYTELVFGTWNFDKTDDEGKFIK